VSDSATEQPWPGARLGLPESGSRSVASWGRRIAALGIDWITSLLVAGFFVGNGVWGQGPAAWAPMGVFFLEVSVLTALAGGSFGQLVLRMAVLRLDGTPLTLLHAMLRTLLICLVIPAVVFNRDNRGLHDLAVNSVAVRR
jgi:uncharacterized RDD family membrane protein YckC